MSNSYAFLIFCFIMNLVSAQEIICSAEDKNIFNSKIAELKHLTSSENKTGKNIVIVGKSFLNVPYVANTLEVGTTESLVVNLQGLDCTTFVENVLAFSLLLKNETKDIDSYTQLLEKIRYRDGKLSGYSSRLHYFSDWITNNEKKGLLRDITSEIGGQEINKEINFMSTHRDLYRFLKDNDQNFEGIKISETQLNQEKLCFLPQDRIKDNEHLIRSGDIIALTTSIKGLDITHTGIATRESNGRIHLLHASTSGKVVVSKLPLVDYLKKIKNNTGIMIARAISK
ncbi:N-acetylmuramoyl-L-alanine amidase-like domain-containing protein [Aquimarina sp. MMG016]|uniref:N-acetylmuramoyl-L-alanine amidase-like domain-containing protein n=1 Tax=Aquimarina sp. MMG016 TaxID=2822690 RepID=UPI001B3A3377|nr:N-acetylmuramoyl-L-alanine amidase-like domain-containing protein [Aquimarina sp. MMG016]MBQ4821626.1 DUF1460 domain-containing protein [Aquimarina sp. MMG016]